MSKPTKPTPPREPKAPTREHRETYRMSTTIHDGMTLTALLNEVKKASEGVYPGASTREVKRKRSGMPTFDEMTFTQTRGRYDDSDSMVCEYPSAMIVTYTDETMAHLIAKHQADMIAYRGKLAFYEATLTQYEVDLAKWEADQQAAAEARDRAQLAALQAKYPDAGKS